MIDPLVASLSMPQSEREYSQDSEFRRAMEFVLRIGSELDTANQPSTAPPSLGRLRKYELLEKLGEGGMGAFYKARHLRLNKLVAVKVLPRDRMSTPVAVARFERADRTATGHRARLRQASEDHIADYIPANYCDWKAKITSPLTCARGYRPAPAQGPSAPP
jgi:serine/threonine protein kinase